jgi:hypothetical protein
MRCHTYTVGHDEENGILAALWKFLPITDNIYNRSFIMNYAIKHEIPL